MVDSFCLHGAHPSQRVHKPDNVVRIDCKSKFMLARRSVKLLTAAIFAERPWFLNFAISTVKPNETVGSLIPVNKAVVPSNNLSIESSNGIHKEICPIAMPLWIFDANDLAQRLLIVKLCQACQRPQQMLPMGLLMHIACRVDPVPKFCHHYWSTAKEG